MLETLKKLDRSPTFPLHLAILDLTPCVGAGAGYVGAAVLNASGYRGYVATTAAIQLAIGNKLTTSVLNVCCSLFDFWDRKDQETSRFRSPKPAQT